jgi:hydrogenase expression/formation protein HypC
MCLAAPARVTSISDNTATVDYGGVETRCRLDTLAEEVAVGDYVLIHTGFAIRRLSPEDGEETLKLFDELARSLEEEKPIGDRMSPASSATPEAPPKPNRNASSQTSSEPEPNASRSVANEESGSGSGS